MVRNSGIIYTTSSLDIQLLSPGGQRGGRGQEHLGGLPGWLPRGGAGGGPGYLEDV